MIAIRVIAISTDIAASVRKTMKDPRYGFPAYTEIATGSAPCRHCLRMISAGERWTLFTHDAFDGIETLPLPGRCTFTQKAASVIQKMAAFLWGFETVHER
jgi:hypothetical protein